jgi:hypothetical protein
MKTPALKNVTLAFLVSSLAFVARADTLTNDFSTPFDYVANGIIGNTNWDGVYLRGGDIVGGNIGGSGSGVQNTASTASPFGGYLNLQNVGGDWAGAGDDGFFIYKVVAGDFDVSVHNVPGTLSGGTGFDNRGNNFVGLMVRAYHTNNSGAPFSTTLTNNAENNIQLWRFNEFGLDGEINVATNGVRNEYVFGTYAGVNTDTNSDRYFRIVRSGNALSFFVKTNVSDAWYQITNGLGASGVLTRSDWNGVALQVGIADAAFSTASRDAIFDDFSLSGPNVTFPAALPPGPSAIVTTATNTGGSLTLSWTTNGGNGSLVVMSRRPIQHNPVQGIVYNASASYGDANARLGGADEYVVYSGSNTSVTVTNLGANNITYYVAVYSYVTNSPPVYNTASPATNAFVGPGIITSASIAAVTNNIPVNGAVKLSLIASFSTGETSDQSAATTWNSSDTGIAGVNAVGVVSGVASGTATITATFGAFTPSTNITVHSPVTFTDTFTATNTYLSTGLIGTPYDGLFLNFGDVPGGAAGADGNGSTVTMDSQLTSTNGLYISSVQSTWSSAGNDGPFLYKIAPGSANGVSGDFTAVLHINTMNTLNGVFAGLMARTYNSANHGAGPGGTEWHVNYWKQQNGFTSIRRTQAGAGGATVQATGPAAANGWLCLQRVGTNFYFFEKQNATDLWTLVTSLGMSAASNSAPMEVGIAQQSTAGVNATTVFDNFMLDAPGIVTAVAVPPPASNVVMTLNGNLSITITYNAPTNPAAANNFFRSVVIMRDGGPVTAQPWTGMGLGGNSVFGDANNNIGDGNYVVYRSPAPTTTGIQSVTVTGLIPGHTYYAAVYTFDGLGTTRTFNQNASTANSSSQDGVLQFLEVLPTPPIPRGGIGFMQVIGHYTGGGTLNVSPFAAITSDNTNVIKVLSGVLTGITNGTANITLVYSGVTNTANVTVRSPAFTDNFDANHDYLASDVTGTPWHGLYNASPATNPIPSSLYVPLPGSGATVADANITSNSVLTITAAGDGWENALVGGFFLFKYVPGDFQMAIHILTNDYLATLGEPGGGQFQYHQPGLLARAYGADTNGNVGTPFGTVVTNANGTNDLGEYWVSFCRFDEFSIGSYARRNLDSAVLQSGQTGELGDTNYWLLIVRSKGTEFDFYRRLNATDPWKQVINKTHYSISQFAGRPMQVGIMAGPWSNPAGASRTIHFERFMLDVASGSPLQITLAGANVTLSWPPIPNATLQSTDRLNPLNWQNVPGTPTLGPNGYSLTIPIGPGTKFFRLVQ